jgi:catechol 2,3-dioxygenase-like lactoylglutathione lyase family enzyme
VAIVSQQYALLANFYQSLFGMRTSKTVERTVRAITVGDGYVGLNINPRKAGRPAGLDHFGVEVEDVPTVLDRMKTRYPAADYIERPSTRPFAGITANDPDGNVFDLAEKTSKLNEIYADQAEKAWTQDRYLNKFAIRTLNAEACAEFYAEVFELQPLNKTSEADGWHLSDGRVTLSILPWSIPMFENMSIKRPGPDHIGFKVESMEAFKAHMTAVAGSNPYLAPMPLGGSKEADARRNFLARSATGKMQIADPGAVWIDITDE